MESRKAHSSPSVRERARMAATALCHHRTTTTTTIPTTSITRDAIRRNHCRRRPTFELNSLLFVLTAFAAVAAAALIPGTLADADLRRERLRHDPGWQPAIPLRGDLRVDPDYARNGIDIKALEAAIRASSKRQPAAAAAAVDYDEDDPEAADALRRRGFWNGAGGRAGAGSSNGGVGFGSDKVAGAAAAADAFRGNKNQFAKAVEVNAGDPFELIETGSVAGSPTDTSSAASALTTTTTTNTGSLSTASGLSLSTSSLPTTTTTLSSISISSIGSQAISTKTSTTFASQTGSTNAVGAPVGDGSWQQYSGAVSHRASLADGGVLAILLAATAFALL